MDEECDFELVGGLATTDEHANGTKNSVAVKWFRHETDQWRRFNCHPWTYAALMAQVRAIEPNFRGQLFYRDIDGDAIVFDTETEVQTMLLYHREQLKTDTIKLESKELLKEGKKNEGTAVDDFADYDWQDPCQLINGSRQNGDAKPTEHNTGHITTTAGGTHRQSDKPEQYKCMHCTHISRSKMEQWEHAKLHIPKLTCELCGFVTEYQHHMEYHYRNHNGPKPFKCTICEYTCVNEAMLNLHMKSHRSVFQFCCQDCTYQSKYCHSLKMHLKKYNHKPAPAGSSSFAKSSDSHGESSQSSGHTPSKNAGTEEGTAENGKNGENK